MKKGMSNITSVTVFHTCLRCYTKDFSMNAAHCFHHSKHLKLTLICPGEAISHHEILVSINEKKRKF